MPSVKSCSWKEFFGALLPSMQKNPIQNNLLIGFMNICQQPSYSPPEGSLFIVAQDDDGKALMGAVRLSGNNSLCFSYPITEGPLLDEFMLFISKVDHNHFISCTGQDSVILQKNCPRKLSIIMTDSIMSLDRDTFKFLDLIGDKPKIRLGTSEHITDLVSQFQQFVTDVDFPAVSAVEAERIIQARISSSTIWVLEEADHKVIGSISHQPLDEKSTRINYVFINPAARGLGYGKLIVNLLISQLFDSFETVLIIADLGKEAPRRAYVSNGFKHVEYLYQMKFRL